MKLSNSVIITVLLGISALLLSSLIPGGPIENRDFSHINPAVLTAFNVFLTVLDLGALVLMYFTYKKRAWAYTGAFVTAIAFFAVYAVDLALLFPKSPTPMSSALALVEVLGMTAAVPLMIYSRYLVQESDKAIGSNLPNGVMRYGFAALMLSGIGIVIFATNAAITSGAA